MYLAENQMYMDSVFMIRNGDFGSNYDFKLIGAVLGLMLVGYYYYRHKKLDYLWAYLTGFTIWFSVEWFLQSMGIRAIPDVFLFGKPISSFVQALLRGGFEGALIVTLGLFFADGLLAKGKERWIFATIFFLFLSWIVYYSLAQSLPEKDVGGDVFSRRDMLNPIGVVLLVGAFIVSAYWTFFRTSMSGRNRLIGVYLVMVTIALVWNIAEFSANTRWIESGSFENPVRATPVVEFLALAWDTCIEIAMAYVPFVVIPYFLKLIK